MSLWDSIVRYIRILPLKVLKAVVSVPSETGSGKLMYRIKLTGVETIALEIRSSNSNYHFRTSCERLISRTPWWRNPQTRSRSVISVTYLSSKCSMYALIIVVTDSPRQFPAGTFGSRNHTLKAIPDSKDISVVYYPVPINRRGVRRKWH